MKLTAYSKTIFCLALLLCWGNCVPSARAQAWHELILIGDLGPVRIHTPRDSYNAIFQSEVRVFPNGTANGFLRLFPTDSTPEHADEVLVAFIHGDVRFKRDGAVARVLLRGRTAEGNLVVVTVTPEASEDCLIYTTVGTDVHATWEAPGRIVVNR